MTYAVIDTNVFVSSFLTRHSNAATLRVVQAMGERVFIPLYNESILAEYHEVLSRGKFGISTDVVGALIDKIRTLGKQANPVLSDEKFADEDDRVFYEVVMSHKDEGAKLITGNAKHFPKNPIVVTAAQFCEMLGL